MTTIETPRSSLFIVRFTEREECGSCRWIRGAEVVIATSAAEALEIFAASISDGVDVLEVTAERGPVHADPYAGELSFVSGGQEATVGCTGVVQARARALQIAQKTGVWCAVYGVLGGGSSLLCEVEPNGAVAVETHRPYKISGCTEIVEAGL